MRSQYAGTITPPAPTITFSNGSITDAKSGSYSVYLQGRNRAGVTAYSDRTDFTVAAGQSIVITIPATTRQSGCDLHEVIVAIARNSINPINATVVATYDGYESDATTARLLPAQIILSEDEHLELSKSLSTRSQLPLSPIHGMRRYVDSESQILAYNAIADTWNAVYPNSFSTYVVNSFAPGGCDRDIADIDARTVNVPDYDSSGSLSRPVKFWIVNDTSSAIPQGTRIRISFDIKGIDYSSEFAGLVEITPLGFVDSVSGILDTSDIPQAGTQVTYQGDRQTDLVLPKPLPAGIAYALQVQLSFQSFELNNQVLQGDTIRIYPRLATLYAKYDEGGDLLGNYILPKDKRRRIVPRLGLSALSLGGSGRVGSYTFRDLGEQVVVGLAPNTANQKCVITSNGSCFVSDTIPESSALRCVIGTVAGVGKATDWSSAIALDSSKVLKVQVDYPSTVRADYPDAIASSPDGELNASRVRIYVRSTSGIQQFEGVVTVGNTTDTFTVSGEGGASIPDLPIANSDFGLYAPTSFVPSIEVGASSFASGSYQVAIAFYYDGLTVTSIDHSTLNGSIYEVSGDLEDLFAVRRSWGESISQNSIQDSDFFPWQTRKLSGSKDLIYYDPTATEADDSINVWKPTSIDSNFPGRWLRYKAAIDPTVALPYLKLQLIPDPPPTLEGEVAVFAHAIDGRVKQRAPNNGSVTLLAGGGSVVRTWDDVDWDNVDWDSLIVGDTTSDSGGQTGSQTDPFLNDVVLLIPFDGDDGSTTITDVKNHTITNHGVILTTSNKKYGTASGNFVNNNSRNWLEVAASSDFNFTNPYTIEFAHFLNTIDSQIFFLMGEPQTQGYFLFYAANENYAFQSYNLATGQAFSEVIPTTIALNNWAYLAITILQRTVKFWLNGNLIFTANNINLPSGDFPISVSYSSSGVDGLIDGFKLTKNIRYTETFTPPDDYLFIG